MKVWVFPVADNNEKICIVRNQRESKDAIEILGKDRSPVDQKADNAI